MALLIIWLLDMNELVYTWCLLHSLMTSGQHKCKQPPRNIRDTFTQAAWRGGLGRISPLNANASWCVPDEGCVTGKGMKAVTQVVSQTRHKMSPVSESKSDT